MSAIGQEGSHSHNVPRPSRCRIARRERQGQGQLPLPLESSCGGVQLSLDPTLLERDIRKLRRSVDVVIVSLHWGIESSVSVHPFARELAHQGVDAGADLILGHHPHVPQGIETYKGAVIVYSLGNLIFGHGHRYWGDNMVVRATGTRRGIEKIELIPIAGAGRSIGQPSILKGRRALALLQLLKHRCRALGRRWRSPMIAVSSVFSLFPRGLGRGLERDPLNLVPFPD